MDTEVRLAHQDWVMACDGRKMLLMRNRGSAVLPELEVSETLEAASNPSTGEQGNDRPGRAFHPGGRSAMEETDRHEAGEQAFAGEVAGAVAAALASARSGGLVVAAPPRMMGYLRNELPGEVRSRVKAEVTKELVNLPPAEILRHVTGG